MSDTQAVQVAIEHENYIPIPRELIERQLQAGVDDLVHNDFVQFCRLLRGVYHFEFHDFSDQLMQKYYALDPNNQTSQHSWLKNIDYEQEEEEFLLAFFELMEKANFQPLTQHDLDFAEEEDYLFTLPVEIDWSQHDEEMLGQFFKRYPELLVEGRQPEYIDKILLFRRGVGEDVTHKLFLLEKIDTIISNAVLNVLSMIAGWFGKDPFPTKLPKAEFVAPKPSDTVGDQEKTSIFETRYLERRSLTNSKWKLFRKTTLKEPTFEQLVVLFRFKTPPAKRNKPAPEKDRGVHIKLFRDIPMADLEVTFPEKKLSMKPKDLVSLVITGIVGLFVTLYKFVFAAAFNPLLAFIAVIGIGGYTLKIVLGYKNSKDRYQSMVTSTLYAKNLDNEAGVIHSLLASMEDQEFLEALLAYYFLWQEGPYTEQELDARCEDFLHKTFGLEIDFEVTDALGKLDREGLLRSKNDQLSVPPLRKALEHLDYKWDNYFQYNTQ